VNQCPPWVKLGKTQHEHIFSGVPPERTSPAGNTGIASFQIPKLCEQMGGPDLELSRARYAEPWIVADLLRREVIATAADRSKSPVPQREARDRDAAPDHHGDISSQQTSGAQVSSPQSRRSRDTSVGSSSSEPSGPENRARPISSICVRTPTVFPQTIHPWPVSENISSTRVTASCRDWQRTTGQIVPPPKAEIPSVPAARSPSRANTLLGRQLGRTWG